MALCQIEVFSQALKMQTQVTVVIPQKKTVGEIGIANGASDTAYPCLYLLHGLSDDHSIWLRRTSVERYAAEYGICVVMPEVQRSFYTDMKYGLNYYTYVAKELPALMEELFHLSPRREDRYVAGLSMGGYGALKIALREGKTFCAGAGLSSVTDVVSRKRDETMIPIFGETDPVPAEDDLFALAKAHADDPDRPRLYMAVGTEDTLYEQNIRLRDELDRLGYDLTYREGPGRHSWAFWDEYIQYVLAWMFGKK